MPMNIQVHDIIELKKPHPCGSKNWTVLRIGADFRVRCNGCGREFMIPRPKLEKNIRKIIPDTEQLS